MTPRLAGSLALIALTTSGCVDGLCESFEIGDPEPIEVEDFTPLPEGYELVASDGSCGQGRKPFDCGRTAEISVPPPTSLPDAAHRLRDHVEDRGWHPCESLHSLVGRCYEIGPT